MHLRIRLLATVVLMIAIWGADHGKATHAVSTAKGPTQTTSHSQDGLTVGKQPSNLVTLRQPGISGERTAEPAKRTQPVKRTGRTSGSAHRPVSQDIKTSLLARDAHRLSGRSGGGINTSLGEFLITAYTNSPSDTGKSAGTPEYGVTASGAHTVAGTTIAADWSVLPEGTIVQIEGLPGTYIVQDTGSAVKGKHIDLFVATEQQAVQWGRKERQVTVIRWGTSHS